MHFGPFQKSLSRLVSVLNLALSVEAFNLVDQKFVRLKGLKDLLGRSSFKSLEPPECKRQSVEPKARKTTDCENGQ